MSDPQFVGPLDRLLFMRTLPQVAGLETREMALLARQATEVVLRKGDVVLRAGEPVDRIFVVVRGRISVSTGGREIMHCQPGDNVGIIPALAVMVLKSYLSALERTSVQLIVVLGARDPDTGAVVPLLRRGAKRYVQRGRDGSWEVVRE